MRLIAILSVNCARQRVALERVKRASYATLIVVAVLVGAWPEPARATGETCVPADRFSIYDSDFAGFTPTNQQTGGTQLMGAGYWRLYKEPEFTIQNGYDPIRIVGVNPILSYASATPPVLFADIFSTYGAGQYFAYGNTGFLGVCGDTTQGGGWSHFFIDISGNVSHYNYAAVSTSTALSFPESNTAITSGVVSGASSTPLVTVSYFIDTNEITVRNRPDYIQAYVTTATDNAFTRGGRIILPLSAGASSTTFYLDDAHPDGQYNANIYFWSMQSGGAGAPVFRPVSVNYTIAGGVVTSSAVVSASEGLLSGRLTFDEPCSITSLSGCITNAVGYLFYPSTASVQSLQTLADDLQNRQPFVYFYETPVLWDSLWNSSSSQAITVSASTSIGSITFLSAGLLSSIPLTATVRTMIGYLLWFMLALTLYYRTQRIFNSSEKTV